jgi:hypothetical protein
MELYEWKVFAEPFGGGPARWYAMHTDFCFRISAKTFEELVAQIWIFELAQPVCTST